MVMDSIYSADDAIRRFTSAYTPFGNTLLPIYASLLLISLVILNSRKQIYLFARFAYSCFVAPIGHSTEQKGRLDAFYSSQATIYDATRSRLLKGREDMLRLAASQLEQQAQDAKLLGREEAKLCWVDIGGGTGYNIETMDKYFPIENFHAVFLVDLCE